jgi:hypothetical protein
MVKSKDISLKAILIAIGVGVWIIVFQNAGVIPSKQNVYVKGGYIDADVKGAVDVNGTVDVRGNVNVDNTVSVSIDQVLGTNGQKYYFYNR